MLRNLRCEISGHQSERNRRLEARKPSSTRGWRRSKEALEPSSLEGLRRSKTEQRYHFTINIPPMLVYIPYMDPMGYHPMTACPIAPLLHFWVAERNPFVLGPLATGGSARRRSEPETAWIAAPVSSDMEGWEIPYRNDEMQVLCGFIEKTTMNIYIYIDYL